MWERVRYESVFPRSQSTTVGAPSRFPNCTCGSGLGWALQSWMQQSSSIWLNLNDSDSGHFNLLIRKVDLSSASFPFLSHPPTVLSLDPMKISSKGHKCVYSSFWLAVQIIRTLAKCQNCDSNQPLSLAMQLVSVQTTKVGNQHAPEVGPCPYMGMPADDAIWSNMHSQIKLIAISRQSKYYVALSHVLKKWASQVMKMWRE